METLGVPATVFPDASPSASSEPIPGKIPTSPQSPPWSGVGSKLQSIVNISPQRHKGRRSRRPPSSGLPESFETGFTNLGILSSLISGLIISQCWSAADVNNQRYMFGALMCLVPEFQNFVSEQVLTLDPTVGSEQSLAHKGMALFDLKSHLEQLERYPFAGEAGCERDPKFQAVVSLLYDEFPGKYMMAWVNTHFDMESVTEVMSLVHLPQNMYAWASATSLLAVVLSVAGLVALSMTPAKKHDEAFKTVILLQLAMFVGVVLLIILGTVLFVVAHNLVVRRQTPFYEPVLWQAVIFPWERFFIPCVTTALVLAVAQIAYVQKTYNHMPYFLWLVPGAYMLFYHDDEHASEEPLKPCDSKHEADDGLGSEQDP